MSHLRPLTLTLVLLSACSVPKLTDLGEKRCDSDAGHACIAGYACQSGVCKIPTGTPCTAGQTKVCGTDVGECVRGNQRCIEGVFGDCEGSIGPALEICDGKDNDCDNAVDEDLTTSPACEKQAGVCAGKVKSCVAGSYVATCGASEYGTDYQATETRCDGKDNDCNSMVDEGVGGGPCPAFGVCIGFQRACTAGVPGLCLAPGFETTETSCDNLDNDCDGMVDEGIVSSTACTLNAGVCSNTFAACRNGAIESTCTSASYGMNFENNESLCDGLDNDCDGVTDRQRDGGFVRVGTCELSSGVCGGARRVCLAGNGEAPCTAASYGPSYEVSESSCDNLDNDCDGRVDVSKEASLLITPNAPSKHISLAASSQGGSAAVYVDQRRAAARVFFRRFDGALRAVGNEFELSDSNATSTDRPSLVRLGADYAVVWIETVAGTTRIMLARVANSGTIAWSRAVISGVSLFNDPRVATNADGASDIAVVWIGSDLALRGSTTSAGGTEVIAPRTLVGPPELVFGVDVTRRQITGDFVVGWAPQLNGTFRARFQAFNDSLVGLSTPREAAIANETTTSIRVAVSGDTGEVLGAWMGSIAQPDGGTTSTVRYLPNALASPLPLIASSFAGISADLSLATTATGAAAFWSQGLPSARLMGTTLGSDAGVRDFSPMGITGLFAAGLTSLDGGVVQVGYEADRGTGLDLFGQVICRP